MLFIPLAVLVVWAGYLGLRAGQVPTDTNIINRYAAAYLETSGADAKLTDCAATSHPDETIRMVITCTHSSGVVTTYYVGPRGAALPEPEGPSA